VRTLALISFLSGLLLLGPPTHSQAGCGCDKPPPAPAAVIPNFAPGGTQVTFFYDGLQLGQQWVVTFQNGSIATSARGFVVLQRALTDPTGQTRQLQLMVTVPTEAALGPTRITASTSTASFTVPEESFTVIGKTLSVSELEIEYDVNDYRTAVGSDGTLYIGVGGLDIVCKAMAFSATIMRMTPGGQLQADKIVVFNAQGYLLDDSVNGADHFSFRSNKMSYWRHSFDSYCVNHQFGGVQEIDPDDSNWHLDGTPHVDYSTLIFAIAGHSADEPTLPTGEVVFDLHVQSAPASNMPERSEEHVQER
jgi:hypothetical protein